MTPQRAEDRSAPSASHEPTDEALIEAVRRGGPDGRKAYGVLARRHQAWLVRLLTYILKSQTHAEDVAQEAFLRAYERLPNAGRIESFRRWMRTLATRLAYNARRDAATRDRYEERAPGPQAAVSPELYVGRRETIDHVLAELPYSYREVLVLRYLEELDIAEIAALLDVGTSAAKMRLKRARDAFLELHERLDEADAID